MTVTAAFSQDLDSWSFQAVPTESVRGKRRFTYSTTNAWLPLSGPVVLRGPSASLSSRGGNSDTPAAADGHRVDTGRGWAGAALSPPARPSLLGTFSALLLRGWETPSPYCPGGKPVLRKTSVPRSGEAGFGAPMPFLLHLNVNDGEEAAIKDFKKSCPLPSRNHQRHAAAGSRPQVLSYLTTTATLQQGTGLWVLGYLTSPAVSTGLSQETNLLLQLNSLASEQPLHGSKGWPSVRARVSPAAWLVRTLGDLFTLRI